MTSRRVSAYILGIEINSISYRILMTDISELEYFTRLVLVGFPITLDARRAVTYLFNVRLREEGDRAGRRYSQVWFCHLF